MRAEKQEEDSDIDILVEMEYPVGLDFVSYKLELEELTGLKVDLGTTVSKYAKPYIEKELETIYVKGTKFPSSENSVF